MKPPPTLLAVLDGPNPSSFCTFCRGTESIGHVLLTTTDRQTDRQTHLPDGHGTKDVEENEGAVGDVAAHQVAMREALHQREGLKW